MEEQKEAVPGEEFVEPPSRWSGALRSLVLPLALLAVILGGLWYWDRRDDGLSVEQGGFGVVELPVGKNATGENTAPEIGRAGPDFILEKLGGGSLRLSDFQGRPVVLNFWASWCAPCRAELPELVAAYARYEDDGLEIIAVNLQEADATVLDFADEFGLTFPIVFDRGGWLSDVWRLAGPFSGIPTSYFLDATGVVRALVYGPMSERVLEEKLASILPGGGG